MTEMASSLLSIMTNPTRGAVPVRGTGGGVPLTGTPGGHDRLSRRLVNLRPCHAHHTTKGVCCATAPVVPEPAKKSSTQTFSCEEALRIRFRMPSGFWVA